MSRQRLADLLLYPQEDLDFEVKNWLDLKGDNSHKATFAKAAMAIANHGGGFIAFGFEETDNGICEAGGRPETLDGYNQDRINGIVQRYCEPSFHCAVHSIERPTGNIFPVVQVPGGLPVPVIARRGSPDGNTIAKDAIYVRKPGPKSETPRNAKEWNELLTRCILNRRDELVDQIRDLQSREVRQMATPGKEDRLEEWISKSHKQWCVLVDQLPADSGARFPHGSYNFAYEILGKPRGIGLAQLPDVLKASVVRHTGWPPFWYPTRREIQPYPNEGTVECWLGRDPRLRLEDQDPAACDFWRISPDGLAYLLRGYQEDGMDLLRAGAARIDLGSTLDVTLPIWRLGEALLQAQRLAGNLFHEPTTIKFVARYAGLKGRSLVTLNASRYLRTREACRQSEIVLSAHVDSNSVSVNLPKIVHSFLSPLYALFGFFELPKKLVADELAEMRGRNS